MVSGASQTGKTTELMRRLSQAQRVVAWDPEEQWCARPGFAYTTTLEQLHRYLTAQHLAGGSFRVAYRPLGPRRERFQGFTALVYWHGRYRIQPLDVVIEEVTYVTTSQKAQENWGALLTTGLKRGISLWVIAQRWAEADKTGVGNASDYIVFRPAPRDVKYVSQMTGLPPAVLAQLRDHQYVHLDSRTGAATDSNGKKIEIFTPGA